jgi:hypothetical protein
MPRNCAFSQRVAGPWTANSLVPNTTRRTSSRPPPSSNRLGANPQLAPISAAAASGIVV